MTKPCCATEMSQRSGRLPAPFPGTGSLVGASRAGRLGYPLSVSPTILRVRGFRFYFFSREERRAHVHVQHADGEAMFWIEPAVELHGNYGLKPKHIAEAENLIEEHLNEIRRAWAKHFPS
jgi:hypothetical protein